MHELSIVSGIVESVLDFVEAREIKKVLGVRLAVGELTHLEIEQLQFCYTALVEQTAVQGSTLEVDVVPARVSCPHCLYEGLPKYWEDALSMAPVPTLQCPQCGKATEATQGHECAIKTIKYVT
ncbi:hydrogenase maturation nickel metallochaperone HypA [Pedosphaera parvula]|uniref:Hydrogenase maturation factor HypA n=1 Tax=Pedosphaera parvula (strain Ellin514) TaxID=320771 RepID=B9XAS5_PEDPL|nr:hydrogenase maturation nickel metallochaperone HypA [Pedosphaera parvula]EEF63110.1 hydrogenase expression/synthesis HypA [Pedosphaera parvula Ellin514]